MKVKLELGYILRQLKLLQRRNYPKSRFVALDIDIFKDGELQEFDIDEFIEMHQWLDKVENEMFEDYYKDNLVLNEDDIFKCFDKMSLNDRNYLLNSLNKRYKSQKGTNNDTKNL